MVLQSVIGVVVAKFGDGKAASPKPTAEAQAVLDQLAALAAKPVETLTPTQARA